MIFILTGPVNSGKTSLLKKMIENDADKTLSGFLSLKHFSDQKHTGYDLWDFEKNITLPFLRLKENYSETDADLQIGKYAIVKQTLDYAKQLIVNASSKKTFIVDEVGLLELDNKGFWPTLHPLISVNKTSFLLVIRKQLVSPWQKKLNCHVHEIFEVSLPSIYEKITQVLYEKI